MSDSDSNTGAARPKAETEQQSDWDPRISPRGQRVAILLLAMAVVFLGARDFARPTQPVAPVTQATYYRDKYTLRAELDSVTKYFMGRIDNQTAETRKAFATVAQRMQVHENVTRALQQSSFNVKLDDGQTHAMRAFLTAMSDAFDFPNGGKAPEQPYVFLRSTGKREANKTAFRWEPVGAAPAEDDTVAQPVQ